MKKTLPKALSVLFTLSSLFSLAPRVGAQEQLNLIAIPPRVDEITLKPGESKQTTVKVKNESQSEITIEVGVKDFIVTDDKGTVTPLDEVPENAERWSLSSWITLSETKLALGPNETKPVEVLVTVPESAMPGGHYAFVYYQPMSEGLIGQGSKTSVVQQVGSLLYVTVDGPINEEAYVRRLKVPPFSEYGPISFLTEIDNLSDVHIAPSGSITVTNLLGQLSTTLKLDEKNIFPYTSRVFENTWNKKWLLGRYKAQLQAGYGDSGQGLVATVFFWVIPWKIILSLTLAVLIVLLIVILLGQKAKKVPQE